MLKTHNAVKLFIVHKGGCNGYSEELYEEFINDNNLCNKNFLKFLTRKQFELALLRVCREYSGEIMYRDLYAKKNNNRIYVININT